VTTKPKKREPRPAGEAAPHPAAVLLARKPFLDTIMKKERR
jgi:hypothetical protein